MRTDGSHMHVHNNQVRLQRCLRRCNPLIGLILIPCSADGSKPRAPPARFFKASHFESASRPLPRSLIGVVVPVHLVRHHSGVSRFLDDGFVASWLNGFAVASDLPAVSASSDDDTGYAGSASSSSSGSGSDDGFPDGVDG